MAWTFHDRTPVYVQIADRLRNAILKGEYRPGEQIPPVRQLAIEAAVNRVLDDGYRTADIWREGFVKVGCKEMGAAIVARL